jgi:hypothetical protein
MRVRISPEPLYTIEYNYRIRPRTVFTCERCWKYSPNIVCKECFPSPCFPPSYKCEKPKPDDYEEYKKWDEWYIWRYLTDYDTDPEEQYQF